MSKSRHPYMTEVVDLFKYQWRSFVMSAVVLLAVFTLGLLVEPGVLSLMLAVPPAVVVFLTCVARINDLGPDQNGILDHMRRIGFSFLGAGVVLVVAAVATPAYVIPWRVVLLLWGLAFVFVTTPTQPPWPYYISGAYKEATSFHDHLARFTGSIRRMANELSVEDLTEAVQRKAVKDDAKRTGSMGEPHD